MIASAARRTAVTIRLARRDDIDQLEALIRRSARGLSRDFYSDAEIEAAIAHVFGVDSTLVDDGTYFVAEEDGRPLACGGWSWRRTLFGGDGTAGRDAAPLDPRADAARIRAFFVDPSAARNGLGSVMLDACETAAIVGGFGTAALMATMPGVPFYAARGYAAQPAVSLDLDGASVSFVPMSKTLVAKVPQ